VSRTTNDEDAMGWHPSNLEPWTASLTKLLGQGDNIIHWPDGYLLRKGIGMFFGIDETFPGKFGMSIRIFHDPISGWNQGVSPFAQS
jgi:hypothetical protein